MILGRVRERRERVEVIADAQEITLDQEIEEERSVQVICRHTERRAGVAEGIAGRLEVEVGIHVAHRRSKGQYIAAVEHMRVGLIDANLDGVGILVEAGVEARKHAGSCHVTRQRVQRHRAVGPAAG